MILRYSLFQKYRVHVFHVAPWAQQPMTPKLLLPRQCVPKQKARALKLTSQAQARLSSSLKQQRQDTTTTTTPAPASPHHRTANPDFTCSHRARPTLPSTTTSQHQLLPAEFQYPSALRCTPPSLNTYQLHLHSSSPPANCYSHNPSLTPSIHDELTAAD